MGTADIHTVSNMCYTHTHSHTQNRLFTLCIIIHFAIHRTKSANTAKGKKLPNKWNSEHHASDVNWTSFWNASMSSCGADSCWWCVCMTTTENTFQVCIFTLNKIFRNIVELLLLACCCCWWNVCRYITMSMGLKSHGITSTSWCCSMVGDKCATLMELQCEI